MTAATEGPLTQLARDLQERHQQFQQQLTEAALQTAANPVAALSALDHCWIEVDRLEQKELAFLQQMGAWGSQQIPQTKDSWNENRLQILVPKAQVLTILGRYDESLATIEAARSRLSDPNHPASMMLDALEVAILQAKA